jgi:type I restriction enzyme R subunit
LPHWQQSGAVYFATFRLADSIPSHLLRDWSQERETSLKFHPQPWTDEVDREYHNTFSGRFEQWLDAGHGSCILRRRNYGEVVNRALAHFESADETVGFGCYA